MNIFISVKHKFYVRKQWIFFLRLPQTDILDRVTAFLGKSIHVIKTNMG